MKSKDLIEKATHHITEDRKALKELYRKLSESKSSDGELLPPIMISESLVKIADSLTKQTGQLVDLAKLKHSTEKTEKKKPDPLDGFDSEDIDGIFDEFETN